MLYRLFLALQFQHMLAFGWVVDINHRERPQIARFSSSNSWTLHQDNAATASLDDDDIITAAATVTKETSPLLGIRSLGVDYGLARTGLAITMGFAPRQLTIVDEADSAILVDQVIRYAKSEGASQIILGLPLHKNGTESEQTVLTRIFGDKLARKALSTLGNVPIILWDERYTSKEAAARVHAQDPGRLLRGTLDAEAACIILENYYYDHGIGAEEILLEDDVRQACLGEYERYKVGIQQEKQAQLDKRHANLSRREEMLERSRQAQQVAMALAKDSKPKKKKKKK